MKKSSIVLGFLIGAAAGIAIGTLMAPESGVKTRKKLRKKGKHLLDDISDKAYILAAYANQVNNEVDRLADEIDAAIEQAADEATARIGEVIKGFGEGK
jgi:gas vesicle protein